MGGHSFQVARVLNVLFCQVALIRATVEGKGESMRSIVLAAILLSAMTSACAPQRKQAASLGPVISYECGTRFRVSSSSADAVTLSWKADEGTDSGGVFLGRHRSGIIQRSTSFTSKADGAVSLYLRGRKVSSSFNARLACPRPAVPAKAPDSVTTAVWTRVIAESNVVRDGRGTRVVRNALYISFTEGATDVERADAIASINGTVVGGIKFGPRGQFVVTIPFELNAANDSLIGPVSRARDAIASRRGVFNANTLNLDPNVKP